jgi:hypothetical protein
MCETEIEPYEKDGNEISDLVSLSGRWEFDIFSGVLAESVVPWVYRLMRPIYRVSNSI